MNRLTFKSYEGSMELDNERGLYRGKLLFIDDMVTYEATTPAELRTEFEAAVDDYIETCRELGLPPQVYHDQQRGDLDRTPT